MANQNEVAIILSADTANLKAQLAGARQDIEASVGSGGTLGANIQRTGVLFDEFGRVASGAVQSVSVTGKVLASTLRGDLAPAEQRAGDEGTRFHRQLFESARLTRSFVDAIGTAVPGLSGLTGAFTRLGRETASFSASQIVATAGLLGTAVAIGNAIALGKEYVDTQNAANAAVRGMDFSASIAGLKTAGDALSAYEANWKRATTDMAGTQSSFAERMGARWAGISVAMQAAAGGMTALTDAQAAWARSAQQTWDLQARGQGILATLIAQVAEEKAQLTLAREAATNYPDLSATYDREAASIRTLATERANQAIQEALVVDIRLRAAGLTDMADQRMAQIAAQAAATRGAAFAQADQVIVQGAQAVAAARAKEIEDLGKLAQVQGQAAVAAFAAQGAEVAARLAAAQADAQYYGGAIAGLERYQAARRAALVGQLNEELATLARVAAADQQAQQERIAALEPGNLAREAATRQLVQMETETNAKRQQLLDDYRVKFIANDAQVEQERRGNLERILALEKATWDRTVAYGGVSAAAIVAELARVAQVEGQSAQARIQAESAWATAIRSLRAEVASAGRAEADAAIAALREQGQEYVSLAALEQQQTTSRAEAARTLQTFLEGGVVSTKKLTEAWAQADMAAKAAQLSGSAFGSMTRQSAETALEALRGFAPTAEAAASALGQTSVAASKLDQASEALGDAGAAAGTAFTRGIQGGLDATLAAVDGFYTTLDAKITAGNSKIGDSIYDTFVSRVIRKLDEERARA
jgi:hypothetical protein